MTLKYSYSNVKKKYKYVTYILIVKPLILSCLHFLTTTNKLQPLVYKLIYNQINEHGLSCPTNWTALKHMATCLDFPIIPPQSFFVVVDLFFVVFVFCMRTCRNRFIHFHAEVILFPVLTADFYFQVLISMLPSFEVGCHQQVLKQFL